MTRRNPMVAVAGVLLLAGVAEAKETLRARAVHAGAGVQSTNLTCQIERFTSDAERTAWREAFLAGGQDALVEKWKAEKADVGSCSFTQTLAYRVRAALSLPTGNGRKIFIATDRPITDYEAARATHSEEYPIGWIQVELDAEGKGEGQLIGAASLTMEGDQLHLRSYTTEPLRLIQVKVTEK